MAFDPTGTTRIRLRYEREMRKRFTWLLRLARRAILKENVFGLSATDQSFDPDGGARSFAGFTRSEDKAKAFSVWLDAKATKGILEIQEGRTIQATAANGWQNKYIDSAYRKGIRDAAKETGAFTASSANVRSEFLKPVHADRAGLLYSRNLEALAGITDTMSEQIRDVLSEGLIDGQHPNILARQVSDRVNKIGITRARTLARTEVIATHAESTLNMYKEAGVYDVSNEAEFQDSGDDRVCPDCESLSGNVYSIEDARGIIPVHPNCRCRWLPVIREDLPS